ncbi:glycosyltransferase [Hungatella effluvii]|uniref:glycosyltransferase n=1 Tax=Hungatella effluvii TaxID=1096246 RepID=UPI002A7F1598|nr:glycosyltransferase [Hungatella effluvii]
MTNVYIGELPPPYGGVTRKNKLTYENVFIDANTVFFDLVEFKRSKKLCVSLCVKLLCNIRVSNHMIIGVGTSGRRKLLLLARFILTGTNGLHKTMVIGMGGQIGIPEKESGLLRFLMKRVGSTWVESQTMIERLNNIDIKNVYLFPNCREDEGACLPRKNTGKLKLVYFSKICEEKGMDLVIEAFDKIEQIATLDIYGEVDASYKDRFEEFLKIFNSVRYHGIFKDSTLVYQELNKYDAIILLTHWIGEGVPGALIESKMAGITAIVSDWNYNKEVVLDGEEGIVLKRNSPEELIKSVNYLHENRDELDRFKQSSFDSRGRYCIESYCPLILEALKKE